MTTQGQRDQMSHPHVPQRGPAYNRVQMHTSPERLLNSLCLRYVLALRALAMVGLALGLMLTGPALGLRFSWWLVAIVAPLALYTAWSWQRLSGGMVVHSSTLLTQLLADLLALSLLFYLSGGSGNPFTALLLLPVTVAAATLPPLLTWLVTGLAILSYTLLMFFHVPLEGTPHQMHGFTVHVWGMWFGFVLSALLVAFFVARIGATLRHNAAALARAREEALEAERLVALGTLAAGTAHELGTPLATMAVLARELEHELEDDRDLAAQLGLLRDQIERCKGILSGMARKAGQLRAEAGESLPLDRFLEGLLEHWRADHPDCTLQVSMTGDDPPPRVIVDRTLAQALENLLNNAAKASPGWVSFDARWGNRDLSLAIRDEGPGLPPGVREELGRPFVSTKPPGEGMGLGIYLARNTIERLGGTLRFLDRQPRGTRVEIELPLNQLLSDGADG
ncbi:MAG: sensor histidine kinase [Gammaproteobacteria bacterium]|nr:MAG: sensor histidine kinase [Gammaproteobacteria bacterium]